MITKEQFLEEHNKLSPPNLKATMALLTRFQEEKKPLLKNNGWSMEKLRIPFMSWLLASSPAKKEETEKKKGKPRFKNYPETHYEN